MLLLTIRTDKPESELGLYNDASQLTYEVWPAHRQLAETIHPKIKELLSSQAKKLEDIEGIVCFQGPGSFTGLRIGITVANALAMGLSVPIVATQDPGWVEHGIQRILGGDTDYPALPHYGAEVHITQQKR